MNRNERRKAVKLGAHWVKIRHNGTVEVCWGGETCGCVPASEGQPAKPKRTAAGPQDAQRPRTARIRTVSLLISAQTPTEVPLFQEPRYDESPALPKQPVE
jgi:hypothetical protein